MASDCRLASLSLLRADQNSLHSDGDAQRPLCGRDSCLTRCLVNNLLMRMTGPSAVTAAQAVLGRKAWWCSLSMRLPAILPCLLAASQGKDQPPLKQSPQLWQAILQLPQTATAMFHASPQRYRGPEQLFLVHLAERQLGLLLCTYLIHAMPQLHNQSTTTEQPLQKPLRQQAQASAQAKQCPTSRSSRRKQESLMLWPQACLTRGVPQKTRLYLVSSCPPPSLTPGNCKSEAASTHLQASPSDNSSPIHRIYKE